MKSYEELTNRLLERRDRYVAEQKEKRKRGARVAVSLCGVCAVALLGFGLWQGSLAEVPSEQSAEDAVYPGVRDTVDDKNGESLTEDRIVVNTFKELPSEKLRLNLEEKDFVEMTGEEMAEYYGLDCIPDVPADLKPWEEGLYGIYRKDGEVYWDQNVLNFSNEDVTRHVNVEVAKGQIPWLDYGRFGAEDDVSVINNVEVTIGKTDDGCYFTEFLHKNVGFIISAEGLSLDEFVSVIASIVQ